jgi:(1->4)-alpha-D-glucan 1-alpha-D-glucosylmutase
MQIPSATYRIQLNRDFTFEHLQQIIDYLHQLGISTIYGSPITTASPGSLHGYDVSDPHTINPEIGTVSDFRTIADKLAAKNMSWLQDIVPNHMAFTPANFRLMDVLERDAHSEYYRFFDVNLLHPAADLNGKLMVPFLGTGLRECIANGDIKLSFSEKGFTIDVYDSRYPLSVGA